jgi:hypothetical protein
MCFGCCCRLSDKCGKLPIIRNPINHALLGLIENHDENFDLQGHQEDLEHLCVHHGELETLIYLLNDPNRMAYRKSNESKFFHYSLFRGLCSMIIKNQYPGEVIDLFIDRLKNELTFPVYIQSEYIGVIRNADRFELDLQIIISRQMRWEIENDLLKIEFMASFPFDDMIDLQNIQIFLLDRPKWIMRKMRAWMIRTKRRMLISLLNEEIYNDLSNLIVKYNI